MRLKFSKFQNKHLESKLNKLNQVGATISRRRPSLSVSKDMPRKEPREAGHMRDLCVTEQ
jgi:hypothetical protein